MTDNNRMPIEHLEDRKNKEIEHSRIRRSILQGYERRSDTHKTEELNNLADLIRDKEAFQKHFSNIKFYSISQSSQEFLESWLKNKCKPGLRILDFACGNGENGIYASQCGAETTGIDISPEGIENANLNAIQAGMADRCKFEVMDGENMEFEDNTFDLIVEYGALHHVDLPRAMEELRRVLKPEGEMICVEALRHNPIIHWYRKRTPHLRTEWEVDHILSVDDLNIVKKYFGEISVNFFHLLVIAAVPFRKTPLFRPLRHVLDRVDRLILKNCSIGKFAWIMIFSARLPRK